MELSAREIITRLARMRREMARTMYDLMTSMSDLEQQWYMERARACGRDIQVLEDSLRQLRDSR